MEATRTQDQGATGDGSPEPVLPADAPDSLKKGARGEKVSGKEEAGAISYLLAGETKPLAFPVKVDFDTPEGPKKLTFWVRQLDGDRILELEEENTDKSTSGPFQKLDDIRCNAAIVAEATIEWVDETGASTDPRDPVFVGRWEDPKLAVEKRFAYQAGLLDGVAGQIRRVSGYDPRRVGQADMTAARDAVGSS